MTKKTLLKRIKELERRVTDLAGVNGDLRCYKDNYRAAPQSGHYYITSMWTGQLLCDRFEELYKFLGVDRKQEEAKTFLSHKKTLTDRVQDALRRSE